jgi:Cu/Ag efflux protein CusF
MRRSAPRMIRKFARFLSAALVIFAVLSISACSTRKVTSTAVKRFPVEGEVLKMNPGDQTATIKHQAIAGWMGAMTMDYQIPSKADYAKLHTGDHIKGTVFVQDQEFWIGDIQDDAKQP